ncbi:MAG: phosphate acyltransferase PlsX [Chloroflexi bacterium]|nr:phosphate acyltransferase PlsX [Chloroflexota bacterium]
MKIALDAMGGDRAPLEIIRGAIEAAREYGVEVLLVGKREEIEPELNWPSAKGLPIQVVDASQVIDMDEHPASAVRQKQDSSLVVGINLLRNGEADAFVSAGNSGAVVAASLFSLGRLNDIDRPAIGTLLPVPTGSILLLDAGANTDCEPGQLLQFARLGSVYMERVMDVDEPRVGLLSNGTEETKGNRLTLEAHRLLKESGLNFVGNVEGNELARDRADVIVADGFTGNIAIKVTEGVAEMIIEIVNEMLVSKIHRRLAGLMLKGGYREIFSRLHYSQYGGAPLLGVNGVVIIAHGRSNARAIKNAIGAAKRAVAGGLIKAMGAGPAPSEEKRERRFRPRRRRGRGGGRRDGGEAASAGQSSS